MEYENLKKILSDKKIIKFKLYSLDYVIKQVKDGVVIYPILYPKQWRKYTSFVDLLYNYTFYNEPLIDNLDKVHLLD